MQVRERESQTVLVRLCSSKLSPWGDFGLVFLAMEPESKGEFMKTQSERHLLILISQLSLRGAMPRGYCCLGQFCAEVIIECLTQTQNAPVEL